MSQDAKKLAGLTDEGLAEALGLDLELIQSARRNFDRITGLSAPGGLKRMLLDSATEVEDTRDVGPVLIERLIDFGNPARWAEIGQIKGLGTETIIALTTALAEADIDGLIEGVWSEQEEREEPIELMDVTSIGGSSEVLESPWFTGIVPGEFVALNGYVIPIGDDFGEDYGFSVQSELTPGFAACLPLTYGGVSLVGAPSGLTCLVGLGLPGGRLQPLGFFPPLQDPLVLVGWSLKLLIVMLNVRVVDALLALKRQIYRNLIDMLKCFGFDPDNPNIKREGGGDQLLKIYFLLLVLFKEEQDMKTLDAVVAEIENCLKELDQEIDRTANPAEKARLIAKRKRLTKKKDALEDALQKKRFFVRFIARKYLEGTGNEADDIEEKGFEDHDKAIVEKLLALMDAAVKAAGDMNRLRKELRRLGGSAGPDQPPLSPSPDKVRRELEKIKRQYEAQRSRFEREQKANAKRQVQRIKTAKRKGNLERLIDEYIASMAGLFDRNLNLLHLVGGVMPKEELAATRKALQKFNAIKTLIEAETAIIEEAVQREQDAIRRLVDPELHAAKLNLLSQLKTVVETQSTEMLGGPTVNFNTPNPDLGDLIEAKRQHAEHVKKDAKDRDKPLKEAKKRLLKACR